MAQFKYELEDFIVKEICGVDLVDEGSFYHIYLMKKTNYTTERAVTQLSKSLHIQRKFIGYAGTKDKNAITYQYISIKGVSKERILNLKLKDISLEFIGYSKKFINLGDLKGNSFEITLRDLPNNFKIDMKEEFIVPNYFDDQRFSNANLEIGLELLKNDFKKAIEIITTTDGDFKEPILEHLSKHENDFIGALKKLPKKTILFYLHSVQSYFFNLILSRKIKETSNSLYKINYSQGELIFSDKYSKIEDVPLIGYLTNDFEGVLKEKNITHKNFLIKSLPEFSLEGDKRENFFEVNNFETSEIEDDDKFENRKKCVVKFDLGSGSYATIVLKNILAMNNLELKENKKLIIHD